MLRPLFKFPPSANVGLGVSVSPQQRSKVCASETNRAAATIVLGENTATVACPGFEPTTFWSVRYDRKSHRAQLSIRYSNRNYNCSIAGLGAGKAQRYVASDFDWLSDRLFDARVIAVVEVVDGSV